MMIKLDSVFKVNFGIIDAVKEECHESLAEMKEACKTKLECQLLQFDIDRKNYERTILEQKQKLAN